MLDPIIQKNDKKAGALIITLSIIVFVAVALLSRIKIDVDLGFDVHLFAAINALINSTVSVLLVLALAAVKQKKYHLHKKQY